MMPDFSSLIQAIIRLFPLSLIPQILSLQLTQPLEKVWGVVWVIGYRGKRMEIKTLAECQQQPEGTGDAADVVKHRSPIRIQI